MSHFFDNVLETKALTERRFGKRAIFLMTRVYACYDRVLKGMKGYKQSIKTQAKVLVSTIDHLSEYFSSSTACRLMRLSTHQYYRLKNKVHCSASVLNLCFKTHPQQLSNSEVSTIKLALEKPFDSLAHRVDIFYHLLRNGKLACSLTTFYKYAALLAGRVSRAKNKKDWLGFRTNQLFEHLHIDTTFVQTDLDGKLRVAFVKDNYSRAILHGKVVPSGMSCHIRDLLHETFDRYQLIPPNEKLHIISDGGAENQGDVTQYLTQLGKRVIKLTAKLNFDYSNSMVESANHLFKNVFLKNRTIRNAEHLQGLVEEFRQWSGDNRYPTDLMGYTPNEVLHGKRPDKNLFAQQIKEARKQRYLTNKTARFCEVCS